MTDAELHTLTGAYALNALDEQEAEDFAHHLLDCEACIREVREMQATAALLARAVAETPPPELQQRVMTAIGQVRQLPPQTTVVSMRRWRLRGLPYLAAAAMSGAGGRRGWPRRGLRRWWTGRRGRPAGRSSYGPVRR
jgi:anti-sigma factor RsiW